MTPRKSLIFSAVILATTGFSVQAEAAQLASHRAAYSMKAGEIRAGNAIAGISGVFLYQVRKICGGWVVEQTGTMSMHLTTGEEVPQNFNFSSFEADDAKRYRFAVDMGEGPGGSFQGEAHMGPDGGKVDYTADENQSFDLPAGVMMPMAYTQWVLERAAAGEISLDATVFEGYEIEGAKTLTAFINPLRPGSAKVDNPLLQRPGWNVRFAYFLPGDRSGLPEVEMEADIRDNGVSSRWLQDYGDFTVEMNLERLEVLPDEGC